MNIGKLTRSTYVEHELDLTGLSKKEIGCVIKDLDSFGFKIISQEKDYIIASKRTNFNGLTRPSGPVKPA